MRTLHSIHLLSYIFRELRESPDPPRGDDAKEIRGDAKN
jgi:hypothetical protein